MGIFKSTWESTPFQETILKSIWRDGPFPYGDGSVTNSFQNRVCDHLGIDNKIPKREYFPIWIPYMVIPVWKWGGRFQNSPLGTPRSKIEFATIWGLTHIRNMHHCTQAKIGHFESHSWPHSWQKVYLLVQGVYSQWFDVLAPDKSPIVASKMHNLCHDDAAMHCSNYGVDYMAWKWICVSLIFGMVVLWFLMQNQNRPSPCLLRD